MEEQYIDSKQKSSAVVKILITAIAWATTFVLVSMAVEEIGPITLGGLRFFTAGLILLIYLKYQRFDFSKLKGSWLHLFVLGLLSFAIGNATMYYSLQFLPSTTVSMMLDLITPLVLLFGIIWLKEIPALPQYIGLIMAMAGVILYFYPQHIPIDNSGFLVLVFGMFGFAGYTVLGRFVARSGRVGFLAQTTFPLLFGGAVLLVLGLIVEGLPAISLRLILILAWLVVINTILGYILYNQGIQVLSAIQVNVILNLAPFFTAIIAWFLLGERITPRQILAMAVVFIGTFLVQTRSLNFFRKKERYPEI